VLEGLDDVPWRKLRHAFGGAGDVPDAIRALRSDDPDVREEALEELRTTIWHQETVYSATAPAVRFLADVALAEDTPPETRFWLVAQLAWIAEGTGAAAAEAHAAVREQLPRFLAWLDEEPDPDARLNLARLAAAFAEESAAVVPRLERLVAVEEDPDKSALLLLMLGMLGERSERVDAAIRRIPDDYVDEEERREIAEEHAGDDGGARLREVLGDVEGWAIKAPKP
jgi:hypothetical protein